MLTDLETYAQTRINNSPIALDAVRSCRESLEKLIIKMDALETAFDKIAERSRERFRPLAYPCADGIRGSSFTIPVEFLAETM